MKEEGVKAIKKLLDSYKGKRKFVQSVEVAVNFKGVDFSKQDNRLNLNVVLPNGKGKIPKVLVYADAKSIVEAANSAGAKVISSEELETVSHDKERMKELLEYVALAEPALMSKVARSLGTFLGPKGRMPKPLVGIDAASAISNAAKSVNIITRGKYLPTIHCAVGAESMDVKSITENIDAVLGGLSAAVGSQNVRSVYVKLSMSPPVKII